MVAQQTRKTKYQRENRVIPRCKRGVAHHYGLERLTAYTEQTQTRYIYDGRGSVIQTLGSQGTETMAYSAYGELLTEKVSGYGYNGEYYDAATGMLNLRARQYEPAQGRFSQRDSLKGWVTSPRSLNAYLYCYNDAVNLFDASGAKPDLVRNVVMADSNGGGGKSTAAKVANAAQIQAAVSRVGVIGANLSASAAATAANTHALTQAQASSMSDPAAVRHMARANRAQAQATTPTVKDNSFLRSTKGGACMTQEEYEEVYGPQRAYSTPSLTPQPTPKPTPQPLPAPPPLPTPTPVTTVYLTVSAPTPTATPVLIKVEATGLFPTLVPASPTPTPIPEPTPTPTRPSWIYYQGNNEGVAKALDIAIEIQQNTTRKYQYGEWDCSGFVNTVLWNFFPRTTEKGKGIAGGTEIQYYLGVKLGWEHGTDMSEIQPGDLIYWWKATDGKYNHVAIYMGNGMIIDNSSEGDMSIRSIDDVRMKTRGREWLRPNYNN